MDWFTSTDKLHWIWCFLWASKCVSEKKLYNRRKGWMGCQTDFQEDQLGFVSTFSLRTRSFDINNVITYCYTIRAHRCFTSLMVIVYRLLPYCESVRTFEWQIYKSLVLSKRFLLVYQPETQVTFRTWMVAVAQIEICNICDKNCHVFET